MTQDQALEILKTGQNVFLTGEPGAGKTYTIGRFVQWMEEQGREYAVTASTGIAASHLDGTTIHSWSGLGIARNLTMNQAEAIGEKNFIWRRIAPVRTLIIDEVSMLDAVLLNDISNIMKVVHRNSFSFGGVQIVFVGDFFQLPPVARPDEEPKDFAFEAESWHQADPRICYLTEQHRQSDAEFLGILSSMRNGEVTEQQKRRLEACQLNEKPETKLFTHNADVDRLNMRHLGNIEGEEKTYHMDEGGDERTIATLKKYCLSPEVLSLKVGAIVMFTRNDFELGYVNGTIGKVVDFDDDDGRPVVMILENEKRVKPSWEKWKTEESTGKVKGWIRQIPLRLAWAITVHKSQGMSLDSASIDLSKTFEFGQGYVAISRVKSLQGLHLTGINDKVFEMHPKVVEQDAIFRQKSEQA